MQKRHFLVQEDNGEYRLRELEPAIAQSVSLFGTIMGQCRVIKSIHWVFYFMNCHMENHQADKIAAELTHEFLRGQR